MLSGKCSSSHRSLLVLLPSTWCPAVAQPHRNLSGNILDLSAGTALASLNTAPLSAACATELFPRIPASAAADAPCKRWRREMALVNASGMEDGFCFMDKPRLGKISKHHKDEIEIH